MKTISNDGIEFIKSFEGCYLTAYDDLQPKVVLTSSTKIIGTLTIGWGHTGDVKIGQTITKEQADKMLVNDLTSYINHVNNPKYVPFTSQLNQNQFDALVSFCYNCGQGNLKNLCVNRTITQVPNEMLKYVKSKGITLRGLVRRREAEKQLFEKPVKAVDSMEQNNAKRIDELESVIRKITADLTKLSDKVAEIEAPKWFVQEFPDAVKMLSQKTGTNDFWRAFAMTLRISQNKIK